jgi:hypothetical protein
MSDAKFGDAGHLDGNIDGCVIFTYNKDNAFDHDKIVAAPTKAFVDGYSLAPKWGIKGKVTKQVKPCPDITSAAVEGIHKFMQNLLPIQCQTSVENLASVSGLGGPQIPANCGKVVLQATKKGDVTTFRSQPTGIFRIAGKGNYTTVSLADLVNDYKDTGAQDNPTKEQILSLFSKSEKCREAKLGPGEGIYVPAGHLLKEDYVTEGVFARVTGIPPLECCSMPKPACAYAHKNFLIAQGCALDEDECMKWYVEVAK